jgi:hypothetical protein
LTENGYAVAEAISMYGMAPEFMYNALPMPGWLALGGDLRGITGYSRAPQDAYIAFPMQTDVYAQATYGHGSDTEISLHVTGGYRPPRWAGGGRYDASTYFWSREHYLMWKQNLGGDHDLYVRVGRFMPVFGLRFAEHVDYTRRYGGTPLYSETYGAAVEYVDAKLEAHLTGFIEDPLIDPVEHFSGAALYTESRPVENTAVGVEAMAKVNSFEHYYRAGLTAKYYLKGPDILLQGEGQYVHHYIHDNGYYSQLVGYLMGTWFIGHGFMFDLGLGHYAENVHIANTYRNAVDGNLHWFATSHIEVILMTRYEAIGLGSGGPSGGWVLWQLHYRL